MYRWGELLTQLKHDRDSYHLKFVIYILFKYMRSYMWLF